MFVSFLFLNAFIMKKLLRVKSAIGIFVIVAALGVPAFVLAQGFDMSSIPGGIPAGFDMSNIPSGTNMGPPANVEELQRKGEEMQKRGEEAQGRGLNGMKRGVKGMKKPISSLEKTIDKVQKAGYTVSQEIIDALAKGKAAIAIIESTSDMEEATTAIEQFNEFVDVMEPNMEPLNMLANFPKILSQATRTLNQLQKNFTTMKAKVAKTEMDLSENVNDIQAKIDALKAVYTLAQELATAGDAVNAFDKLENEFFEPMQDAYQSVGMLQAALNISTAVKNVDKGIKNAEKVITKMKKKKFDTAELQTIVDQAKAKSAELKALVKVKDFDPDAAVAILEELDTLQSDFGDKVDELTDGETQGIGNVTFFNTNAPAMPKEFTAGPPQGIERMDF